MIVKSVEKKSIAEKLGIIAGDVLESINGIKIKDIIDYRFYVSDEFIRLHIRRDGQRHLLEIEKEPDEELGLTFEPISYRCCGNNCIFCFIDQNPPNLRANLYFKDEDFRLSFLHGNYVTLTNISQKDLKRIVQQRLSPLYISVHAVDPEVRRLMLGLKKDDHLLDKIHFLAQNHIELHAQIVLCPNVNDRHYLQQTITTLADFYPALKTIAIVPVGLTKHREQLYPLDAVTPRYSRMVIEQIEPMAAAYRKKFDSYLVYLADEFYLSAGFKMPPASRYEDYAQYENGVGMLRYFMDSFTEQRINFPISIPTSKKIRVVTAQLAQSFFRKEVLPALNSIDGLEAELCPIANDFYGPSVKVTGLLTGTDINHQLQLKAPADLIVLPQNCLNTDGLFLDDWTIADLQKKLKQPILTLDVDFLELFNYI